MVRCYKKPELTISNLWVSSHDRVSDFYLSSWQPGESPIPLLVIRLLLAVVAFAILGWALFGACNPYWLLYLTNWGLVLVCGMLVSGIAVSVVAVMKKFPDGDSSDLPWYVSTYWIFHNSGVSLAFMITALYWILLYDPEAAKLEERQLFWLDVATHGLNSLLALTELLLTRTPMNFAHIYQPLGIGLWYALFTLLYYLCGGTDINGLPYIYEILDWRQKKRAGVMVAVATVGLVFIWCVLFVVSFSRDKVSQMLVRARTLNVQTLNQDQVLTQSTGMPDYGTYGA